MFLNITLVDGNLGINGRFYCEMGQSIFCFNLASTFALIFSALDEILRVLWLDLFMNLFLCCEKYCYVGDCCWRVEKSLVKFIIVL